MNCDINLNLLKYFCEVVDTKNITKASKNLLVSQPAITKSIKDLEYELGIKLFERGRKGVTVTSAGELLYKNTKKIFHDFESTINTIDLLKNNGGCLYIGATTTNFLNFIEPALNKFRKLHPNTHVDIVLEELNVLNNRASVGRLDIVIKNSYENFENFNHIKSFQIKDRFIASKQHFKDLENKKIGLNEILKYPFVLLSSITHGRKNFDLFLKTKGISFKPTYEFNSYSLCRELISCGYGIGIGNPIHYQTDDYIIINTTFELPTRNFDVGYLKNSKNELIQEFIKLL